MPQKLSKPVQMLAIGGLVIGSYLFIGPMLSPEAPAKKVAKPVAKKKPNKGPILYTEEDKTAKFDSVTANLKNSFKPIVAKTVKSGPGGAAQQNNLPSQFAGGEQGWTYTGTAEIDGVLQALLENKASGDSVFLRVGDTWKGISVEEITDDSLVLSSPETGTEHTLHLPTEEAVASGPAGFAPAAPNGQLQGNIGQLNVSPDQNMTGGANGGNMGNFGNFGGGNSRRNGGNNGGGNNRRRGGGGRGAFGG